MIKLKNKVAIVTGGSRGIGRATALMLAQAGAKVIFTYNQHPKPAKNLEARLKKYHKNSMAIKADLGNLEDIKNLFNLVKAKYHRLDILINNAGIMKRRLLLLTSENDLNEQININLKGVFLCMQQALKIMLNQKSGKIINLASIVGKSGDKGLSAYAATKGGIIALTKSAAKEMGEIGITVNAVAPGVIDTEMNQELTPEQKQKLIQQISLHRLGKPEDVAKVILFLCSNLSSYLNGEIIGIDGGQIM